jgi:hypothetical protein
VNKLFVYINGILTFPGESNNWTGRAVTWTHIHTPFRAEKIEYYVGPISRAFGQKKRAHKLVRTMEFYKGWSFTLVGHSNGCEVIRDALEELEWPVLDHLHLISGACNADFEQAGFNRLNCPVTVWRALQDQALKWVGNPIGRLLGYGVLGLTGPVNAKIPFETVDKNFGHSGWFSDEETDPTMLRIISS